MNASVLIRRFLIAGLAVFLAGCQDSPTESPAPSGAQFARGEVPAVFNRVSPEVMALPQTVFAFQDQAAEQIVFGVEHAGAASAVRGVMDRLGVASSAYRVEVTAPIRFLTTTLRTEHRPTKGGLQIHFSNYLCTLGFNADHDGGRSFFTNSHCTDKQGETDGTIYYQPSSSVSPTSIGTEVHDPAYEKGVLPDCSFNKRCRYSDAARVLYQPGVGSLGEIARTTGVNSGSLDVSGTFDINNQDVSTTSFSGTIHKVGRTTGWTSGSVDGTCATVNVFGSNIQLLCQTLVTNSNVNLVGSGDSGSPVFKDTGSGTAQLVGILWGGSGSATFVFSPLNGLVKDGLGPFNSTTDSGSSSPSPAGTISGRVTDAATVTGISGATVSVEGTIFSATTDGNGDYSVADVPVGTYSVTASATGYTSQTVNGVEVVANETTTVDFALNATTTGTGTVSVQSLVYTTHGGPDGKRHLTVIVTLVDGNGAAVSGASVSIRLDLDGSPYGTASGTTGTDGKVSFGFNNSPSGTYTTAVTNVTASGLTWDGITPPNSFSK